MIDNPFAMVVLIVAIVFGARVLQTRMRTGAGRARPEDAAAMMRMQTEIEALSRRVQVLEKLATDDDRKLAGEIERLRDPRQPGAY